LNIGRKMKKTIALNYRYFVLIIEFCILLLFIVLTYNSFDFSNKKTVFYLSYSDNNTLLNTLNKNGYNTYNIDKLLLLFIDKPMEGWYSLECGKHERIKFFNSLHKKHSQTMSIKVYAGETRLDLTKRLANDMKLDHRHLLDAYDQRSRFKEADIFSGRYILARDADENTTMSYLFNKSNKKLEHFFQIHNLDIENESKLKALFIIASIIQKESNSIKEMPFISSVIYNRLEKGMKLQMDGTLNYGKYTHTIVTPKRIRTDESLYNTYKHKGIPPAPLSSISIEALRAAYLPKQTNYLFFMLNYDGSHNFSATYAEHLENIRLFKERKKKFHELKIKDTNNVKNITTSV